MKNKFFRRAAVLTAALFSFTCMSATAYAQSNEPVAETEPPAAEETTTKPFTPDGTGTVVDNATDEDGKEFFTITTPSENIFYLVIDRQRTENNVYFLNAVTEKDLLALAEAAPEPEVTEPVVQPEPDPEPAPDADGKQLPLHTLTPQLQTLYESFTAGRAEPIDETKPIYFFADDFDGDGTTDLMILFETKQEDPDARDANVSIVSGDSHGGNTITLAAGHGWPISDTVTPYLVDRTVYVTLTEADGTLHPYSLTIHRTESGMDYTVCSDENVR